METAFKVLESAGLAVRDSNTCVGNKLCKRKTSKYPDQTTTPATNPLTSTTASLTTSSASSHPHRRDQTTPDPHLNNHVSYVWYLQVLLCIVIPTKASSQNGYTPCSVLLDVQSWS